MALLRLEPGHHADDLRTRLHPVLLGQRAAGLLVVVPIQVDPVVDEADRHSRPLLVRLVEAPTDVDNDYGQRLTAYLLAPTTGGYVFWIASDDNGRLLLSTSADPPPALSMFP